MNYNVPSDIVKNLHFGSESRSKILSGVNKLADAVESTLGASGQCVIFEDAQGVPVVTKDGVTVADCVILQDPEENMGATLIKQVARNTVKEAGDGTSSSILLTRYLLEALSNSNEEPRKLKEGVDSGLEKVNAELKKNSIRVNKSRLNSVATISTNNDKALGKIIADTFNNVGRNGIVLIEESETGKTYSDVVDGVSFDSKLKSPYFITDRDKGVAELNHPLVLLSLSPIPNLRKILNVVKYCTEKNRELLIIAEVDDNLLKTLLANKAKGNIKVNVVNPAGFGDTKHDTMEDLAILTGGKLFSEELGDDMDLIDVKDLGTVERAITDNKGTVLKVNNANPEDLKERIKSVNKLVNAEKNGYIKKKLEQRLSMLSGKVGVIYVGGDSEVELKERKDRVDDAVHATKAALLSGIVAGGGVALRDASKVLDLSNEGEKALHYAINKPMEIILKNANLSVGDREFKVGQGINAVDGSVVDMVEAKIIDPLLVTQTALKYAVSVANTIVSTNCVISNMRQE